MSYFETPNASNSDIKKIVARHEGRDNPPADGVFDFGDEFHNGITQPLKYNPKRVSEDDQKLISVMHNTFWKDVLCRQIAMTPDFRREHEFYRQNRFGIAAKCKMDGDSKKVGIILELKGLKLSSRKSFLESLEYHNYDQAASWYLNVGSSEAFKYRAQLIVGISKIDPTLMFKELIDRDHILYKHGLAKVHKGVNIWKMYGYN